LSSIVLIASAANLESKEESINMTVFSTHHLLGMPTSEAVAFANSCSKGAVRERVGIYPGAENGETMDTTRTLTAKENIHVYLLLEQHGMNDDGTYNDKKCTALGHCWGKSKTTVKFLHEKIRSNKENSHEAALLLDSFSLPERRGRAMSSLLLLTIFLVCSVVVFSVCSGAVFAGSGGIHNPPATTSRSHPIAALQETMTQHVAAWTHWWHNLPATTPRPHPTAALQEAMTQHCAAWTHWLHKKTAPLEELTLLEREEQVTFREKALELRAQKLAAAVSEMASREVKVALREKNVLARETFANNNSEAALHWKSETTAAVNGGIESLESLLDQMKKQQITMSNINWSTHLSGDVDHIHDQSNDHFSL